MLYVLKCGVVSTARMLTTSICTCLMGNVGEIFTSTRYYIWSRDSTRCFRLRAIAPEEAGMHLVDPVARR